MTTQNEFKGKWWRMIVFPSRNKAMAKTRYFDAELVALADVIVTAESQLRDGTTISIWLTDGHGHTSETKPRWEF